VTGNSEINNRNTPTRGIRVKRADPSGSPEGHQLFACRSSARGSTINLDDEEELEGFGTRHTPPYSNGAVGTKLISCEGEDDEGYKYEK
jgi:hypothetical protein